MRIGDLTAVFGAIAMMGTTIWGVIHGLHSDKRETSKDRQELESWILTQIKQDNQQLRSDREADRKKFSDDLTAIKVKKDAMESELNQQIALKVRENEQLKRRNAALEEENNAYRSRYGKLKGINSDE